MRYDAGELALLVRGGVDLALLRPPADVSEREFEGLVIAVAVGLGWRVMHTRPARTSRGWTTAISGHAGYPDLTLAHPAGVVVIWELKTQSGRVSADQRDWLQALAAAAACAAGALVVGTVRPTDWDGIVRVLTRDQTASS